MAEKDTFTIAIVAIVAIVAAFGVAVLLIVNQGVQPLQSNTVGLAGKAEIVDNAVGLAGKADIVDFDTSGVASAPADEDLELHNYLKQRALEGDEDAQRALLYQQGIEDTENLAGFSYLWSD